MTALLRLFARVPHDPLPPLTHLSMQRCRLGCGMRGVPPAPTEDERLTAFRNAMPVKRGNDLFLFGKGGKRIAPPAGGAR